MGRIICMCRNDDVLVRNQIERINNLVDAGFSGKFYGYKAMYNCYLDKGMKRIGVSKSRHGYVGENLDFIVIDLNLQDAFPSREFFYCMIASIANSSLNRDDEK